MRARQNAAQGLRFIDRENRRMFVGFMGKAQRIQSCEQSSGVKGRRFGLRCSHEPKLAPRRPVPQAAGRCEINRTPPLANYRVLRIMRRRRYIKARRGRSSGVERNLAKVEVVSSNLIARSIFFRGLAV